MKVILLLFIAIGIANPIFDRTVITSIGMLPITTGMENICCALKKIHMPDVLIMVILLIYRYIIVFLKEVQRLWTAYSMRAPKQKGVHFKVWGSMICLAVGVLLLLILRFVPVFEIIGNIFV